ncbi:hypothetical protein, partial [Mesorhizobium sp. M1A.F.Ca.IN.020.04.1.1]|uniref:hypothetical protein n=1 Tax=Mesorhizobium sp. M1A.F.Ca.IN.020.04.1.1 TaxID=2496761 RepID=UPI0019D2380A
PIICSDSDGRQHPPLPPRRQYRKILRNRSGFFGRASAKYRRVDRMNRRRPPSGSAGYFPKRRPLGQATTRYNGPMRGSI